MPQFTPVLMLEAKVSWLHIYSHMNVYYLYIFYTCLLSLLLTISRLFIYYMLFSVILCKGQRKNLNVHRKTFPYGAYHALNESLKTCHIHFVCRLSHIDKKKKHS